MGKQSSRMYGIKVKEKVNYYDVGTTGDVESGSAISISFSNGVWTVKAGAHGHQTAPQNVEWWMNGVQFQNGDTITTFNDGDNVEYHIMEQHRDTIPYVNYMYDVYGNSSRYVKYGTNDMIYRVLPNDAPYSCKVYRLVNGVVESSKVIKSDDVVTYKNKNQGKKLPVYNMLFDWHGQNPETGYPQMSFEAISNTNYIKYHTNPVSKGETIQVFQTEGFTGFEVMDDSDKYTAKNVGKDVNPTVQLIKRRGGAVICEAIKDKVSIISDVYHDHKEVYYNGHYHKAMFLVYDNPSKEVDCWKKKVKDLAFTYADPYWFLMTTANGVEYNGTTYEARKLIRSWKPDTAVNMTLKRTISRTKEVAEDEYYDKFLYSVFSEDGNDSIGIYYKQSVAVDDGEGNVTEEWRTIDSTAFDSSAELPVRYKKLLFDVEDGHWKIYSKAAHITYCGETYKSNKLIASFHVTGSFSGDIGDDTAKYNNSTYYHIVYDIEESENVDQVTVKKQRVTTVQDAQGHNHKEYADLDTRTFTSSDQNVIFHNIQFKVRGNFWTIYSKCGYIKFNGRTYLNNRSILNFNIAERIHIEISDDSDKYEVQEVRTYNVKTPNSSVVTVYEVHTSELTREMKIVKSNGTEEEPWISLKSYEAEYVPYVVDDLSFLYFNKTRTWEMYSNNDSLYINGTNYKIGDLIASWGYLENFKMSGITVTNLSTDSIQLTYSIKSSKGIITNNSIDEDISMYDEEEPDFNVSYSYSKGLWVLKALRDAWCEGIRYAEGQVIKSFKTRVNVNPFSILCQHDDEGTQVNITYNISIDVDAFTGETALRVHTYGKPDQVFSDKDISKNGEEAMLFTKDKLKSMYGYIWKKLGSPGPTPPAKNYNYDIIALAERTDGNYYKYILAIDSTYGSRYARRIQSITGYNYTRLSRASIGLPQGASGAATTDSVYDNMASYTTSYEYCLYSSGAGSEPYASRYSTSGSSLLSQGFGFLNQQGNLNTVLVSHPYNEPETLIITKRSFNRSSMIENITNTTYPGYFVNLSDYVGYIFENDSLLMRKYPLISTWVRPVDVQNQKHGAKISLSDLSVEELYDPYVINLDSIIESVWESMSEAQQQIYGRIYNFEEDWRSNVIFQTGNEMLMSIGTGLMSSASQEEDCQEFWYYDLYKFNFKSGVLTYLASTTVSSPGNASLRAIAQNVFSWMRDPRNGKRYFAAYTYAKTQDERGYWTWKVDKLRIFEAADESIDSILSATVVNEISADSLSSTTVNIWRLDTNTYQEFTIGELLSIEYIKTVGYTKSSGLFKGGKYIYGLYGYKNTNAYSSYLYLDKWVIFLSDPTLRDLTGSFCFLLTSFRNKTYIDEHDYHPNQ